MLYSTRHELLSRSDVAWLRRNLGCLKFVPFEQVNLVVKSDSLDDSSYQGHFWPLEDVDSFSKMLASLLDEGGL